MKNEIDRFAQGYFLAVANMIRKDGDVKTQVRELFREYGGGYDIKLWRKWGIDEDDIEIFKKFRKELL